jgi:DNA polymerase-3 subunit delta
MIIKSFELKKNLKKKFKIYLLYGPNRGLIEDLVNEDLKPVFPKTLYNYTETEILANIDNFKVEIFNKSFFDNDKLIIISQTTDKILNMIQEIEDKKLDDVIIILKSENLDKKSKLRVYFEKNKKLIITPCYDDNYQSLFIILQNILLKHKIKISIQNINFIIEKSNGSRINLKNDLEKIVQFSKKNLSINFNNILKLISSSKDLNISELTDECLAFNKKKTITILNESSTSSENDILILKSFLFKLKRLKKLKKELEKKNDTIQVINSYKPPIFWKDKELVKKQLSFWSLDKINIFIKKINYLEFQIKKNSQISSLLLYNLIIENLSVSNNWS